jgi:hypothetical protein
MIGGRASKETERMDLCSNGRRVLLGNARLVCGLLAVSTLLIMAFAVSSAQAGLLPEEYDVQPTEASLSNSQAAAHADFETRFLLAPDPAQRVGCISLFGGIRPAGGCVPKPWADFRDLEVQLPAGLIANQAAFPTCNNATFFGMQGLFLGEHSAPVCGSDTQVGIVSPGLTGRNGTIFPPGFFREPLYNLEAPGGESGIVARFGFMAVFFPIFIDVRFDPKTDSFIASLVNSPELAEGDVNGTYTRYWGVPTDSSHDSERMNPLEAAACEAPCLGPVPSGLPPTPLMSNPTSCGPKSVGTTGNSYELWPDNMFFDSVSLGEVTGCEGVPFNPSASITPTTRAAGTSSGIEVELNVPQPGLLNPLGRASSHLKESEVALPEGVTLNASAADGLGSCTEEEIGLNTSEEQMVHAENRGAPVSLTFEGESTPILPQRASSAEVQTALEALPKIGSGGVSVSGRPGGPWTVDFGGALAGKDVPAIGGTNSELQLISVRAAGGTYKLKFEGQETGPIAFDATAAQVQAALEGLSAIGAGGVEVIGGKTFEYGPPGPSFEDGSGSALRVAFPGTANEPKIESNASALVNPTGPSYYGAPAEVEAFVEVHVFADGGSASSNDPVQQGGTLRFNNAEPACPASSKIATGELVTPVLKETLRTDLYVAKQEDNPFHSLFAGYLVAKGGGATVKTAARIDVDPKTGQITTTFPENPEQPFSSLSLRFKSGNRGLLTLPSKCGTYASTYKLTPWSGTPPVTGTSSFKIDENCQHAFAPSFSAGSESPLAGAFTTFFTRVTREAGTPQLTGVSAKLPEGVSAKLAGIPYCSDAALASISTEVGSGTPQLENPACPGSSQIGNVTVGTGSGSPLYVSGGKVYLAGPYKGAPISLGVAIPAVAGPFDLGNVMVRLPARLDPTTAQVEILSEPLPTIVHGFPVDLRDLRVNIDRPAFALNPTSCKVEHATATMEGSGGVSAQGSQRFQIGECASLGLKPKLSLRLKGGTHRTQTPALTAILRPREGDANIESIQVTFPNSELFAQKNLGTLCTRVQFAENACPPESIYGTVSATTPLLSEPLTGNVYLRSNPNHKLPDLVTDLRGPASQPIHLEASAVTGTAKGNHLRNTFNFIPDAPLSRVELRLDGGSKGLLENTTDLCAKPYRASVRFQAHNGRTYMVTPRVLPNCSGKQRHRRHRH